MRILVAAAALTLPAAAFAGGYAVPNTNPRDLGMAGSRVAGQDDAAAAFVNPAALAGLEGISVIANATMIDFRSAWTDTAGLAPSRPHVDSAVKPVFPPSIFASYGGTFRGRGWGVGAGFNVPGGGNVFWPGDWPGRFDITTVARRIHGFYLTGGVQPIPQVKVGGGLVYYRTTEHLTQGLNFLSNEGGGEVGTSGGAFSYDLSTEITPVDGLPLTIGFDYKHKGDQSLRGHAHFDGPPASLATRSLDQTVTHDLSFPNVFNAGVACRPVPKLLATFAWTLDRFIVYKRDLFVGDLGTTVFVNRDYRNGYTFRFGAEYDLRPGVQVRAGLLRDIAPTRPEALSPTIPDANVWAAAIGASVQVIPGLVASATYFHAFFDEATAVGTDPFPGRYNTRANIVSVGLAWRMGPQPSGISAALSK